MNKAAAPDSLAHLGAGEGVEPKNIFIVVAVLGLINGMFSPFLGVVIGLMPFWMPEFVTPSLSLTLFFSSLILSITTLLVSGIPAAIYEHATGARESSNTSMIIWLVAAVALTLPAVPVLLSII